MDLERSSYGFLGVLEQNLCWELVLVVKDSTLADWLEKSLRFLTGFSLQKEDLSFVLSSVGICRVFCGIVRAKPSIFRLWAFISVLWYLWRPFLLFSLWALQREPVLSSTASVGGLKRAKSSVSDCWRLERGARLYNQHVASKGKAISSIPKSCDFQRGPNPLTAASWHQEKGCRITVCSLWGPVGAISFLFAACGSLEKIDPAHNSNIQHCTNSCFLKSVKYMLWGQIFNKLDQICWVFFAVVVTCWNVWHL
jgi:hypothetical protein